MNIVLFFSTFLAFIGLYAVLGLLASKKINTITDYFLAGRNLGIGSVMFTLIATQIGGGMLLGTSQQAYEVGIYGIMYTLGMAIGFILLASGFAAKLQSFNVATVADLFYIRYNSLGLKKLASLLSIITMSGILIGQIVGSKTLLMGLGFFNEPFFLTFWLFTILYTMIGGLKAVVATNIFQVLFIFIIFGGIFIYSIYLDPQSLITLAKTQKYFNPPAFSATSLTATLLMPALFSLIEQDLAQCFFAAKNKRVAALSALGASICLLTFALVPIYFGMKAHFLGLSIPAGTSPLIPILQTLVPDMILILALCGIMTAIISTADSLLCAISSNIAYGFDLSFLGGTQLNRSKCITLFAGIGALGASYFVPQNVVRVLIESYEISVGCLLIPLLFCYFTDNVKKEAAIGAIIGGLIGLIGFRFWVPPIPKEILTIIFSLIGYGIGWILPLHNTR